MKCSFVDQFVSYGYASTQIPSRNVVIHFVSHNVLLFRYKILMMEKTYIIFIFITFHTNVYLTCTKINMRDSMIITDYRELMDTSSYIS